MAEPADLQALSILNVLAYAHEAVAVCSGNGLVIVYANKAMLALWGKDSGIIGRAFEEGVPEFVSRPFKVVMNDVLTTGKTHTAIIPAETLHNGTLERHDYAYRFRAVNSPDGSVFLLHTATDVTKLIAADRTMLQAKAQTDAFDREQRLIEELASLNEKLSAANKELAQAREQLAQFNIEPQVKADVRTADLIITEQVLTHQHSEEDERRFLLLLNALPQQVWTSAPDGALNYVNDVIISDFGERPEIIIDLGWQAFVHPDDLPKAISKWERSLRTKREYVTEFRLRFTDGSYYWHLARAIPLVEDGEITFWLGTNTNIHEQKTNENKKDEFISIASHELKTPLTTIKAFFQLSKREATLQSKLNPFMDKAERQIDRLGRLIEDLLDVSKINAGKMVYAKENFDFGQLLNDTVESVQQTTRTHQIELHTNCPITYRGDQSRLEQVLINLLNNAIKYSPGADKIILTCNVEDRNIIVAIQDFGIGIAAENLKDLFERFYRVDNSSARFQGLGLGLFISNEIVKRHGGSFWIESEPDAGSTFYFLLPLSGQQEFRSIATDQQTYYESNFINIRFQSDGEFIDVDWIGYQNYDSVVKGCEVMLNLMKINNCSRVLNDNTLVKGNWSEAADWGAEVWFPAMAEAGLKKFAWIYSPSTFSRISANKSLPSEYDVVQVAFFDEKEEAKAWLLR